jgi:hypothetical protein
MSKVIGISHIELRPGVKGEELEKLYAEELPSANAFEGMQVFLLKGDKGPRAGKYIQIIVLDSVEVRNRLWGSPEAPPGTGEGWTAEVREILEKIGALATMSGPPGWTDYVVIGK